MDILIAASYPLLQQGLRALLQGEKDFRWAGEAESGPEVIAQALDLEPEVTLLDGDLASEGFLEEWRRAGSESRLVLIANPPLALPLGRLYAAGVRAIVPRTARAEEIAAALRAAAQGLFALHPALAGPFLASPRIEPSQELSEPLTERERQVLQLVAQGLANKQIAQRLAISDHTVKFHLSAILSKLGATNRTEAVSAALQRGLVRV